MKREIKYRAWHKELKIMEPVLLICFVNQYVNVLPESELEGGNQLEWKFEEIELMQFTGLLDKNGNEIYEGDLCFWDGAMREWVFADGCFGFKGTVLSAVHKSSYESAQMIVSGNIYEQ